MLAALITWILQGKAFSMVDNLLPRSKWIWVSAPQMEIVNVLHVPCGLGRLISRAVSLSD
jgi:hypothetical protein